MLKTVAQSVEPPSRPQVWIAQVEAWHYRLPVWDLLADHYRDSFELKVYAGLQDGLPYGAENSRDYILELKASPQYPGGHIFSGLPALIKEHSPAVLITETPAQLRWSWKLPLICKHNDVIPISWSKVWTTTRFRYVPQLLLKFVKSNLYRRYDTHIVYGKTSRDKLLSFGVPPDRIFVAQNSIDTRRSEGQVRSLAYKLRAERGLLNAKIILMIARMESAKRHKDILTAWPALRTLDKDICLVLVGTGPLAPQIQTRVEALNDPRVHLLGKVPEGHDYGWIAAADFNIQPGAVGLAVNQSMAFGTVTVIADEPGPDTETVIHGRTGWRYPKGDVKALVALVRKLIDQPEVVSPVVEEARRMMRDEVNIDMMVTQLGRAIEMALEQKKRQI